MNSSTGLVDSHKTQTINTTPPSLKKQTNKQNKQNHHQQQQQQQKHMIENTGHCLIMSRLVQC